MKSLQSNPLRLATRGSQLARWQAERVANLLHVNYPGLIIELVIITTKPDRQPETPLASLGGDKGLFVKELEQALLDGRADAAVHSLKDVPIQELAEGTGLLAFPERADPRDVIVSRHGERLMQLAPGSAVATSAVRRKAQLLIARPDLQTCDVRGNVETRLRKLRDGQFDAIILAAAGLNRLNLQGQISEVISPGRMLPAPGQGILAVQAREDSPWRDVLQSINDADVTLQAETEREFSRRIGADCHSAVGCLVKVRGDAAQLRCVVCDVRGEARLWFQGAAEKTRLPALLDDAISYLMREGAGDLLSAE